MNKKRFIYTAIGVLLVAIIVVCRNTVESLRPITDEELLQRRETPYDVAVAFATALRLNDPLVYELADPSLHPRLDEWLALHQVRKCSRPLDEGLIDGVREPRFSISYGCFLENNQGSYIFKVNDIIISNGKIVQDWGEVSEKGGGG
jgi:hypothetical protein